MSLSRHALSRAAAPEHGQRFSAAHAQADPVQNLVGSEGLVHILDGDNGARVVLPSSVLLHRNVISCCHMFPYVRAWIKERKRE